jgi:hypothetical protein
LLAPSCVRAAADALGFPMVVKRVDGAAAVDMAILQSILDVERFVGTKSSFRGYLAEAFIHGDNYHVDGVMRDGQVLHSWPSRYLYTQWETMYRQRPNISGMLPQTHPLFDPLRRCAAATIAALPAPPGVCSFHAEFFNPEADRIVLGEIACRPGGAGIVKCYENAFGVNLYAVTLQGQAGMLQTVVVDEPSTRYGWAFFPPAVGLLRHRPLSCPLPAVRTFIHEGVPGTRYTGPHFVTDRIAEASFVVDGDDPCETLQEIVDWFDSACEWELDH